jgi:Cu/Ag efflux protein CusF
MTGFTKWFGTAAAVVLLVAPAAATDVVAGGKVKSINAADKTFVLTDLDNKDFTFKYGDNLVVNRAGKEGKSDLKSGDAINLCYDKDATAWTAHYVLVQDGTSKKSELIRGSVKSYDAGKNELTFTSDAQKDVTYPMGKATVRFKMEDTKIENVTAGDRALLIVEILDGKSTLQSVMVDRAK